jgi:hypothetical protein
LVRCCASVSELTAARHNEPRVFPLGSGLALAGAAMMVIGAWGPWVGGRLFHATPGLDLGGDGWLVVSAAILAMLPLLVPLPHSSMKALWVICLGLGAAYVCLIHYREASVDGFDVVWGLELSAAGCGVLVAAGLRLLKP